MKTTNLVLGLLISVGLISCPKGMEDDSGSVTYKALRNVAKMYTNGADEKKCLEELNLIDCTDDEVEDMDIERIEKALWSLVLDKSEGAKARVRSVLALNLESKSKNIELNYRVQSVMFAYFSGCADKEWISQYLPSLNAEVKNINDSCFGEVFEPANGDENTDPCLNAVVGIIGLNYMFGNQETVFELWENRPTTRSKLSADMGFIEEQREGIPGYASQDPKTLIEIWKQATEKRILGDIERIKASRLNP